MPSFPGTKRQVDRARRWLRPAGDDKRFTERRQMEIAWEHIEWLHEAIWTGNKPGIEWFLSRRKNLLRNVMAELVRTHNSTPAASGHYSPLMDLIGEVVVCGNVEIIDLFFEPVPVRRGLPSSYYYRARNYAVSVFRWAIGSRRGKTAVINALQRLPTWHILRNTAFALIQHGGNLANTYEDRDDHHQGPTLHTILLFNEMQAWDRRDTLSYESDVNAWWNVDNQKNARRSREEKRTLSRWWVELDITIERRLGEFYRGFRDGAYLDLDHRLATVVRFLLYKQLEILRPHERERVGIPLRRDSLKLLKTETYYYYGWYLDYCKGNYGFTGHEEQIGIRPHRAPAAERQSRWDGSQRGFSGTRRYSSDSGVRPQRTPAAERQSRSDGSQCRFSGTARYSSDSGTGYE